MHCHFQDKRTPLHWAAHGDHLGVVQHLLTFEPEVDAKDESGWTPLMIAGKYDPPSKVLVRDMLTEAFHLAT